MTIDRNAGEAFLLKRHTVFNQSVPLHAPYRPREIPAPRLPHEIGQHMKEAHRLPVVVLFYFEARRAHLTHALLSFQLSDPGRVKSVPQ
jgi:hypothetical protein